jgi:hypothetical protein
MTSVPSGTTSPTLDTECFFIAPIGKDGTPERKRSDGILRYVVARAADELGLTAVRGDQIGEPGQITLQVIDHILGARAAVADLTALNPNVFYELAVRHTLRLPVALIAEKGCALPFDIAQMRTIFFEHTDLESADNCRREIVAHLREALDKKAVDSPIATSVDIRALQEGNKLERNVAELVTAVEDLSKGQRQTQMQLDRVGRVMSELEFTAQTGVPADLVYELDRALRNLEVKSQGNAELRDEMQRLADMVHYMTRRASSRNRRLRTGPPDSTPTRPVPETTILTGEEKSDQTG